MFTNFRPNRLLSHFRRPFSASSGGDATPEVATSESPATGKSLWFWVTYGRNSPNANV
jgi:hypothetical protein